MNKLIITALMLLSVPAFAFEHFEIAPSVKLLEVPHPAQLGVETRFLGGILGVSVHKGFMPGFNYQEYDVNLDNFDVGLKVYPFSGGLFLGLLKGSQDVEVSRNDTIQGQAVSYRVAVNSDYLTPHIGYEFRFTGGLFLSMQLGWQISSNANTTITTSQDNNPTVTSTPEYQQQKQEAIDIGNNLGNQGLPSVGLLQMGWYF